MSKRPRVKAAELLPVLTAERRLRAVTSAEQDVARLAVNADRMPEMRQLMKARNVPLELLETMPGVGAALLVMMGASVEDAADTVAAMSFEEMESNFGGDYFGFQWQRNGKPVITPTADLARALKFTDPPTVDDAKSPFPAFVVVLPKTGAQLVINTQKHGPDNLRVIYMASHRDGSGHRFIHFDGYTDKMQSFATTSFMAEEAINGMSEGRLPKGNEENAITMSKLCLNLLAYLTMRKERGSDQKPTKRSVKGGGKRSKISMYRVGGEVVLSQVARDAMDGGEGFAGSKVSARFVVRGHWRNQACGKGLQDRRLRWIEPFWKGPESGIVSDRHYLAKP